jgi:hypothetical protein
MIKHFCTQAPEVPIRKFKLAHLTGVRNRLLPNPSSRENAITVDDMGPQSTVPRRQIMWFGPSMRKTEHL